MSSDSYVIGLRVQTEAGQRENKCVHMVWMCLSAWLPGKILDA